MSDYLIDNILPANEIHLLAGPSGTGKTRWLLESLYHQWEKGLPVLGRGSHPVPWMYVAADRSLDSVHETFRNIGIDPAEVNILPAWGDKKKGYLEILDQIQRQKRQMAVIEAFQSFPDGSTHKQVKAFLNEIQTFCDRQKVTIIGICESPKLKPYEIYENPRQRVSGVASWGHFSNTIMLIEPADAKHPSSPQRKLFICPRNNPSLEFTGQFNEDGRLTFEMSPERISEVTKSAWH